jgi:hypothetical protein
MLGKHTLNPDEKTDLKVTFETEGRPGPFQKKVTFTTNVPELDNVEVFSIKGVVKETPAAKILVEPRKVLLQGIEISAGKKQNFSVTNQGSISLIITRIHSKDGTTVYFDAGTHGEMIVEPNQTKSLELELPAKKGEGSQEYILVESNARNAGKAGYFIIVQYSGAGN